MDATYVNNHIREELEGAKGYLSLYSSNHDMEVLNMACDEFRHAHYFYKQATEIPAQLQILHDEVKRMILDTIKQAEEKERQNEIGGNVQNRSD